MKQDQYFRDFQKLCIDILAQSDNCQESQDLFRASRSVPELVTAWQRFWAGVLHEVPEQVIKAFGALYPVYRDDILRAGFYYNEAPPIDAPASMVLIGNSAPVPEASASGSEAPVPLTIAGRHRVYVLGDHPITCTDNANVHIVADSASVTLTGNARCNIERGTVTARDRSTVSGRGIIHCYDSTTILAYGGIVHDHGHLDIRAYNDATIYSFTNRRIEFHDNAKLIYE